MSCDPDTGITVSVLLINDLSLNHRTSISMRLQQQPWPPPACREMLENRYTTPSQHPLTEVFHRCPHTAASRRLGGPCSVVTMRGTCKTPLVGRTLPPWLLCRIRSSDAKLSGGAPGACWTRAPKVPQYSAFPLDQTHGNVSAPAPGWRWLPPCSPPAVAEEMHDSSTSAGTPDSEWRPGSGCWSEIGPGPGRGFRLQATLMTRMSISCPCHLRT
ncbi:hypothetical protein QBC39DRAFT_93951 [Podospora conica]|nr:hypothetical protein QBC39DRAFT_93951 [Schizothecium conicum]